ncbi:fructose-6-phosphate aldolase [Secundilactobacillus similis]|uniref:Transaldolase n=1 Tax=Secundilactobacillus similis DSM 23365 = JCM 2765 TaxID=1423804 RepID=A0A0R2FNY7_9LACO|nr:fructose-6-phosphate aldolase [Secundilactobacillus similis]KRN26269.1 transaldolase [Secundilactobacillus similis DSM 23365 = JCM 2765]
MEWLLDTINLAAIEKGVRDLPLAGVTSNPTIVRREGKVDDFFEHLRQIRRLIGDERTLHVQAVGQTTAGILADAHRIMTEVDSATYIKIPTNAAGLAAMKQLKAEGGHVTATAIYSEFQGRLAIAAGADYLAPYVNRMVNMNIDANQVIAHLAAQIERDHAATKILAASFHTVQQVNDAFTAGAQAVTMGPELIDQALGTPAINDAVAQFTTDWESLYGEGSTINQLPE